MLDTGLVNSHITGIKEGRNYLSHKQKMGKVINEVICIVDKEEPKIKATEGDSKEFNGKEEEKAEEGDEEEEEEEDGFLLIEESDGEENLEDEERGRSRSPSQDEDRGRAPSQDKERGRAPTQDKERGRAPTQDEVPGKAPSQDDDVGKSMAPSRDVNIERPRGPSGYNEKERPRGTSRDDDRGCPRIPRQDNDRGKARAPSQDKDIEGSRIPSQDDAIGKGKTPSRDEDTERPRILGLDEESVKVIRVPGQDLEEKKGRSRRESSEVQGKKGTNQELYRVTIKKGEEVILSKRAGKRSLDDPPPQEQVKKRKKKKKDKPSDSNDKPEEVDKTGKKKKKLKLDSNKDLHFSFWRVFLKEMCSSTHEFVHTVKDPTDEDVDVDVMCCEDSSELCGDAKKEAALRLEMGDGISAPPIVATDQARRSPVDVKPLRVLSLPQSLLKTSTNLAKPLGKLVKIDLRNFKGIDGKKMVPLLKVIGGPRPKSITSDGTSQTSKVPTDPTSLQSTTPSTSKPDATSKSPKIQVIKAASLSKPQLKIPNGSPVSRTSKATPQPSGGNLAMAKLPLTKMYVPISQLKLSQKLSQIRVSTASPDSQDKPLQSGLHKAESKARLSNSPDSEPPSKVPKLTPESQQSKGRSQETTPSRARSILTDIPPSKPKLYKAISMSLHSPRPSNPMKLKAMQPSEKTPSPGFRKVTSESKEPISINKSGKEPTARPSKGTAELSPGSKSPPPQTPSPQPRLSDPRANGKSLPKPPGCLATSPLKVPIIQLSLTPGSSEKVGDSLVCSYCKESFLNQNKLRMHQISKHLDKLRTAPKLMPFDVNLLPKLPAQKSAPSPNSDTKPTQSAISTLLSSSPSSNKTFKFSPKAIPTQLPNGKRVILSLKKGTKNLVLVPKEPGATATGGTGGGGGGTGVGGAGGGCNTVEGSSLVGGSSTVRGESRTVEGSSTIRAVNGAGGGSGVSSSGARGSITGGELRGISDILELERELTDNSRVCTKCRRAGERIAFMKEHLEQHPIKFLTCEKCQQSNTIYKKLMNHLETHIADSDSDCEIISIQS